MPMLLPPSQYDHQPQIPVIEKVVPWNELQQLCRARERPIYNGTGYGVWGCAIVKGGKCYVARLDVPGVKRHELGHCNGWPKDHPGGWYDAPRHDRQSGAAISGRPRSYEKQSARGNIMKSKLALIS